MHKYINVLHWHVSGILTKQNKKHLIQRKKLKIRGWKDDEDEDSQIGQLMYYLVAYEFRRIAREPLLVLRPILGLFMEEGNVSNALLP